MSAFSNYLEAALLDHLLRGIALASPSSVYIALFTGTVNLEGNAPTQEVAGGAYARLEVGGATGRSFTAPANGVSSNNEEWIWPTATASWGVVSHWAVMDAATNGNVLVHGALNNTKDIDTDDAFRVGSGNLTITVSGAFSDYSENAIIDHLFRGNAMASPSSVFIALLNGATGLETNAPTEEVAGGAYARLEVGGATGRSFNAPVGGQCTNGQNWQFPIATASWGLIEQAAVMDGAGNVLIHGPVVTAKQIDEDDGWLIPASTFTLTLQ